MSGFVTHAPRVLLRLEGLAVGATAVGAYALWGGGWGTFALFILAPDLSMLGYLGGRKLGAALYNLAHWEVMPLLALAWGVLGHNPLALNAGLIWLAHIGFDRMLGFGLKYGTGFGATHLGVGGKAKKCADDRSADRASAWTHQA